MRKRRQEGEHRRLTTSQRDQDYRESMADTLRSHRAETTRQTLALDKLHTRNADLARQLSLAQAQEQAARKALHTAEAAARKLRAEMQRLKTTVEQVRTACATDVRKRDKELQRLKGHLASQQRGNKTGLVGASISIRPGSPSLSLVLGGPGSALDNAPDAEDAAYSLRHETTEFLTQLCQSLSDENDSLLGLVRNTLVTLRELQGMPDQSPGRPEGVADVDTDGASVTGQDDTSQHGMLQALPSNYETLATDMDTVLDNLKNLLTNPNFVAVDEVELREEEILRLRAGWEKMEARMREAFTLMDSWRRRMTNGDTIKLEELQMGFSFGLEPGPDDRDDASMEDDEEAVEDGSSVFDEEVDEADNDEDDIEDEVDETVDEPSAIYPPSSAEASAMAQRGKTGDVFKLKLQPNPPALRETDGNKSPSKSPRKVAFSASIPNTPSQVEDENIDGSGIDLIGVENRSRIHSATRAPPSHEPTSHVRARDDGTPRHVRCDSRVAFSSLHDSFQFDSSTDLVPLDPSNKHSQTRKRLSNEAHPEERSSKLTVQDKLRVVQAEAESAAIKAASPVKKTGPVGDAAAGEAKRATRPPRSPMKSRVGGRPRRRKSTLTPEELESLFVMR